jgi:LuxR family transcriptional regulator, maltose regulon positive regulatory protein
MTNLFQPDTGDPRTQNFCSKTVSKVCGKPPDGSICSRGLWENDAVKRKLVWIGLDEYNNAPFVFYKMFCTGILSAWPDNAKIEEILNSNAFYSSPVENTIRILLELTQDDGSYVLVLDDLHTITNKRILNPCRLS